MMSENYNTAKPINRIQYSINYTENFIIILALWTLSSRTRANFSILLKQQFLLFLPRQQLFFYFPPRQEQIFIFHNTTAILYFPPDNDCFYYSADNGCALFHLRKQLFLFIFRHWLLFSISPYTYQPKKVLFLSG